MPVIPDSDFGTRARHRLQDEIVIWLTTTSADGTPQPNPVWFLWEEDADALLIYNANKAKRLEHVAARPMVSLHFDGDGRGSDIVVLTGVAEQALDAPSVDQNEVYLAKYAEQIANMGSDPQRFAQEYSVPLRVQVAKLRGF